MRSFADDETSFLRHALTSTIDSHEIIMTATLNVQLNFSRIIDYDRTDIETVRSNRSEAETSTLRDDDRSAIGEIIGSRTRRRGNDQTIRLIGNQEFPIHMSTDGNHGSIITLQNGNIIEGKRIASQYAAPRLYLNDRMFLYLAFPSIEAVQCSLYFAWQHISQESQSAHVDTDDRSPLRSHLAGSLEEGSVAAHGDDVIHIEVVILEDTRHLHIQMEVAHEKVVISIFHIDLSLLLFQKSQDSFDGNRLLSLVFIAKYCKFQMLFCHLFCHFNYYCYFCKGNNINRIIQQKR